MSGRLKPFDFSLFTDRQLRDLAHQVRREILRRRTLVRARARSGPGLTEIGAPRYRNPANSAETWSGQDPVPAWVRRALERGASLASLEIDADGRD